jgi:predicted aminopeptidase
LTYELIEELNHTKAEIILKKGVDPNFDQIVANVQQAYKQVAVDHPRFILQNQSIKKAIFPGLGDYIGFLAFYQPITGEAILRSDLPILTQPYTIAHEMAHQLGYASETEANFIAFVVATECNDPFLRYSMLLQMFSYAQDAQLLLIAGNNGFDAWKAQIAKNKALLSPAVLKDRVNIKAFFAARSDKQIQASSQLYDQFLKWNQQAAGIASYADVLKWVRAYRIKIDSSTSYSR